ncbi:MAG: aconitate hydratase [Elusimicrobia bacterium HGW-Elusimicrobia-1]|jgi:aconitate hydratase|nr:MAG: aconitate hydratase [Elusimicrobia bacterium HGW-Elusimicrobia-1]
MTPPYNLTRKILKAHLAGADSLPPIGADASVRIDQTLTQDATGTLAYLQFEAIGIPRVRTELSVSYVDHNTIQTGFENADDHRYLAAAASKYGIIFSPAGNGVCHQLHLENFAVPGKTLIGSDSHTPTAGGMGMLAFGAGGLDVACAMAGESFIIKMPAALGVRLVGKLKNYVSAKDVILELLRRLGVKGGVGKVVEYFGPGVKSLDVPSRATITNMGAELGATTSVFPSDEVTKSFMRETGRVSDFRAIAPDDGCVYDEVIELDLSRVEPMVAAPHSPDNVKKISEIAGLKVDQVCIGSCTNSSLADMTAVARILKGKKINPDVSCVVSCGSRNVLLTLSRHGLLDDIIKSGARIIECACGPCIGMGQAPSSGAVTARTFNRNFEGRSGTKDAGVYLVSPVTAALAALHGKFVNPQKYIRKNPSRPLPRLIVDRGMFIKPPRKSSAKELRRGPNIKPLPVFGDFPSTVDGDVLIKLPDNITTDHILPAGAGILPLRSNIPAIAEHTLTAVDAGFVKRAREKTGGIVVAAENYAQGSSREHAALVMKYLGVNMVVAKSFARIHLANLVNFGVLPAVFADKSDYEAIAQGDRIVTENLTGPDGVLSGGSAKIRAHIPRINRHITLEVKLSGRDREIVLAGGLLNYIKKKTSGIEGKKL